jgi:hypothetical protein
MSSGLLGRPPTRAVGAQRIPESISSSSTRCQPLPSGARPPPPRASESRGGASRRGSPRPRRPDSPCSPSCLRGARPKPAGERDSSLNHASHTSPRHVYVPFRRRPISPTTEASERGGGCQSCRDESPSRRKSASRQSATKRRSAKRRCPSSGGSPFHFENPKLGGFDASSGSAPSTHSKVSVPLKGVRRSVTTLILPAVAGSHPPLLIGILVRRRATPSCERPEAPRMSAWTRRRGRRLRARSLLGGPRRCRSPGTSPRSGRGDDGRARDRALGSRRRRDATSAGPCQRTRQTPSGNRRRPPRDTRNTADEAWTGCPSAQNHPGGCSGRQHADGRPAVRFRSSDEPNRAREQGARRR